MPITVNPSTVGQCQDSVKRASKHQLIATVHWQKLAIPTAFTACAAIISPSSLTPRALVQAWRKPGLEVVAKAFLADGLEGAYRAFAALPHTEAGYNERFKFNAEVTKICYRDDAGCTGVRFEDEPLLFVSFSGSAQIPPHNLHSSCIRELVGIVQCCPYSGVPSNPHTEIQIERH